MTISDFSIKHPAIVIILTIAVAVFGVLAATQLNQEVLPDIDFPTVLVSTGYPGAGPEEIEESVTDVLEAELAAISDIDQMTSQSTENASVIQIQFAWGTDVEAKLPEVRERITVAAPGLPSDLPAEPTIRIVGSSELPIVSIGVESDVDRVALTRFLEEEAVPSLAQISGVARVDLIGGVSREVRVELDLDQLLIRGMDPLQVVQAIQAGSVTVPAGSIFYRNDRVTVRGIGELNDLRQLESTIVGARGAVPVYLRDVANVTIATSEREIVPVRNGREIVVIDITKRPEGDTVEITDRTEEILASLSERREAVRFELLRDQRVDISRSITSVRNAALLGGVLAVLIIFLFLRNLRTTTIIAISIPISILLTFSALFLNGQTLNVTTLGGLTVALGMIVDASIVVLESIFRRYRSGESPVKASSIGAREVGGAVVASITTSLAVFIPMLFVQGIAGVILRDVGWTIAFALAASLVAAIVIVPFLCSVLLPDHNDAIRSKVLQPAGGPPDPRTGRPAKESFLNHVERLYGRALSGALREAPLVIVVAIGILAVTFSLFGFLGFEFIPPSDSGEISFRIQTPAGSTLDETEATTMAIAELVQEMVPEMTDSLFAIGQNGAQAQSSSPSASYGYIKLVPADERGRSTFDIIQELGPAIAETIPDNEVIVRSGGTSDQAAQATGGSGFTVRVAGNDLDQLSLAAEAIREVLRQEPTIASTTVDARADARRIDATFDLGTAGRLGVTPRQAGTIARVVFRGADAGTYYSTDGALPIRVVSGFDRDAVSDDVWNRIPVVSHSGALVTMSAFTAPSVAVGYSSIPHYNRRRTVEVTGELLDADIRGTQERMVEALSRLSFPPGIEWTLAGASESITESFRSLAIAAVIAVFLVYVVMVVQFERFLQPLVVLASIPFTLIGVVLALLLFGSNLNIVSFLGIIALAGIVVNNAIVMIDKTNALYRTEGVPLPEAIVRGASSRLRPVLMTTLTTVLGLIPLAIGLGEGSDLLASLGQAIAGGLITSTLVTLFLVPSLYWLVERNAQ